MTFKLICPKCGVMISVSRYRRHKLRNRCSVQHIRKRDKVRRS